MISVKCLLHIIILLNILLGYLTLGENITSIQNRASRLYSTNTFHVAAGSDSTLIVKNKQSVLTDYYVVKNLGEVTVFASIHVNYVYIYGYTVEPGETKKLRIPQERRRSDFILKVKNEHTEGAFVYAAFNDQYDDFKLRDGVSDYLKINSMSLLKSVDTFGAAYIPVVGSTLSTIIEFFWEVGGPDIWHQVSRHLEGLIDSNILDLADNIVTSKVREYRTRLCAFHFDYQTGPQHDESKEKFEDYINNHYLNIAQDLIGLEEEFILERYNPKNRKINYYLLPFYCKTLSLQYEIYSFGLTHQKEMNLSRKIIRSLNSYMQAILYSPGGGAQEYVYSTYREHMRYVMNDCIDGEEIYNCMANERTYVTLNGMDYFSAFSQSMESKVGGFQSLDCNPLFSTYAGRPSHDLNEAGAKYYEPDPLMPGVWDGKCSVIEMVDVFFCDDQPCGLKTYYNDYNEHVMGEENQVIQRVEFRKQLLKSLIVHGTGRVEGLTFEFTDGSIKPVGRRTGDTHSFETKDYIISGIFVTNGVPSINKLALANIAVSYLPNNYNK